ncbi:hypothetical protein [Paenibacillus macerans]|uniref:hypothetical protein n=1 Tax=Paenibacillus macerans TaxID=44252 RepID=UPI003D317C82
MRIWELDSNRSGFETVVFANREVDFPQYFKGKFNGFKIEEWGDIEVKTHKKASIATLPIFPAKE